MKNIFSNLRAGLTVIFMPQRTELDFRPGLGPICMGLALSLLVFGVFDYTRYTGDIYFSDYGAAQLGALLFIGFFTALMLCGIQADYSRLPMLLTVVLSILPWFLVVLLVFKDYSGGLSDFGVLWFIPLCWGMVMFAKSLMITFAQPMLRSYLLIFATTFFTAIVAYDRYFVPELFYAYSSDDYDVYDQVDQEKAYYKQAALLQSKIDQLQPEIPNQADIYFVGFAGNGDEPVFHSEVNIARDVIDNRFNTDGRSMILSSDIEKLDEEPLASAYNLKAALTSVGQIMDVEDDVLLLFLTSHGSADAELQVSLYPFEMKYLGAAELREALDSSGIQWRIIILSACYSGSFIDALADEKTIIMSAAAKDKSSFGCSIDRDITYFGEALFADALGNENGLVEAFDIARASIEKRELAEGKTASEPQISVGKKMRSKLETMDLAGRTSGASR